MVDQISEEEGGIYGSFPNWILLIDTITFEVCEVAQNDYLNIVDDHLPSFKGVSSVSDIYQKSFLSGNIGAWYFYFSKYTHLFVDKLTDLIPEDKLVNERSLWN